MGTIGIYFIKNKSTDKHYIGSSVNIERRIYQHLYLLKIGKCHSPKLQNSFNRHGEESFEFGILEICDLVRLKEREKFWIDNLNSVWGGYNCSNDTECSTRGRIATKEQRAKMSEVQKRLSQSPERRKISSDNLIAYNKSQRGIPKSKEHRVKISLANMGKKMSIGVKEQMSIRMKMSPINYWLGKKRSAEDRLKMSVSHLGQVNSNKPIIQLAIDGAEVNRFESAAEAGRRLGISRTSIKNCLCGYVKTAHHYLWRYV